jgi:hypothetical protein
MRINPMPVYQKGTSRKSRGKARPPNQKEREHGEKVRELGCMAKGCSLKNPELHHCLTGAGGKKDHMKVIGLCPFHHRGEQGIHTLSRRIWQPIYGYEVDHLATVNQLLGIQP